MTSNTPSDGWCPFATAKLVPSHKYWPGNKGRDAVVMHISAGTMSSMIGWFLDEKSDASTHFAIGKDGMLYQFVSVHDTAFGNGASYENGHWIDPEGKVMSPPWSGMRLGENPNWYTISVEHEGQPQDVWTDAMTATNTRLLGWLAQQFPSFVPYVAGTSLIGHCDISPIDRKDDPGSHVNFAQMATIANNGIGATAPRVAALALTPMSDVTPDSTILAPARAQATQAMSYILSRPHGEYTEHDIAQDIIPAYWALGIKAGVDPLIAVAQMIHETGNLTSPRSQRPQRNPAGIGASSSQPNIGVSFPTWCDDAIPAHIGRLLAYTLPDQRANPVQAGLIATALHWRDLDPHMRGIAPTLKGLEDTWAVPGDSYASRIAEIGQAIQDLH